MYILPLFALFAHKQINLLLEEEIDTLKTLMRLNCDPQFLHFVKCLLRRRMLV